MNLNSRVRSLSSQFRGFCWGSSHCAATKQAAAFAGSNITEQQNRLAATAGDSARALNIVHHHKQAAAFAGNNTSKQQYKLTATAGITKRISNKSKLLHKYDHTLGEEEHLALPGFKTLHHWVPSTWPHTE
eukprot:1160261-Pelagomonas_calceolata.AAC.18